MGATPIAGWFIRENPIKMNGLGVPYVRKPPYSACETNTFSQSACATAKCHLDFNPNHFYNRPLRKKPASTLKLRFSRGL